MEKELDELERILRSIVEQPLKKRKDIQMATIDIKDVFKPVENIEQDKFMIEENIQLQKKIAEYKEELFRMESDILEYKNKIDKLNKEKDALRFKEKELREAVLRAKGAIRVLCRIKPTDRACNIRFDDRSIDIDSKQYMLDYVFAPNSTQTDVFSEIDNEIECVMDGFNVCIFAYGQTGSGKTYTMYGSEDDKGIIFRSLERIQNSSISLIENGYIVIYNLRYVEVYNENIRDLISDKQVTIIHDSESVRLKDNEGITSSDINQIIEAVRNSSSRRKTGETNCNTSSSRSHSLFILEVLIKSEKEVIKGSLCLIDLAGSERLNESKAENERLKETQHINRSLSALGNVIVSLKKKDKHIPFRDSKLTHLMQEYLCGRSRTTMIVNLNPENSNETICSLRFATKVSECNLGAASKTVNRYI